MGKVCKTCGAEKADSDFYKHHRICKKCFNEKQYIAFRKKYPLKTDRRMTFPDGMKVCSKCKVKKPLTGFGVAKKGRHYSWCKACNNEQRRLNREHHNEVKREWVANNKDRVLDNGRRYREINKERTKANGKAFQRKGIDNMSDWYVRFLLRNHKRVFKQYFKSVSCTSRNEARHT